MRRSTLNGLGSGNGYSHHKKFRIGLLQQYFRWTFITYATHFLFKWNNSNYNHQWVLGLNPEYFVDVVLILCNIAYTLVSHYEGNISIELYTVMHTLNIDTATFRIIDFILIHIKYAQSPYGNDYSVDNCG